MAFKLTYTDGQEAEYDDDTAWEVDDGVLKMGRTQGDWSVLVSPSHWAVVEVGSATTRAETDAESTEDDAESGDDDGDDAESGDDGDGDDRDNAEHKDKDKDA